ncbi:hypothetical protein NDU88_006113 [Pleurodeles waltl]|uniref:Uncharacterized protein n=1 Tax=Pleurodeles waltl TaxID=8319 RepID=A0AAV7RNM5_PLEWA|nr:hypothetical protein NDU88_006113 [Pleurodeles waltl]
MASGTSVSELPPLRLDPALILGHLGRLASPHNAGRRPDPGAQCSPILEPQLLAFEIAASGLSQAAWSMADRCCGDAAAGCTLHTLSTLLLGVAPPRGKLQVCRPLGWGVRSSFFGLARCWTLEREMERRSGLLLDGSGQAVGRL